MNPTGQVAAAGRVEQRDVRNPFFARLYHHVLSSSETEPVVRARRQLLDGLAGRVVEVGPGNGPNFWLYPASVDEVVAVEPEPYLRARAGEAVAGAPVTIAVTVGDAEHLPVEDGVVDAVIMALVLCSVPDQQRALAEVRRVLHPGGELRVYEHVIAENCIAKGAQRAAQTTFWPRAFGGCHSARDTLAGLRAASFDGSGVRRFVMRAGGEPPMPYILGGARLGDKP